MMKLNKYVVYPSRHAFQLWGRVWQPPCIIRRPTLLSWQVRFGEGCDYELPGADQQDWNKGGGISFDLLTNHTDAIMWAWRWNPVLKMIELAMYAHVDGQRVIARNELMPNDGEVMIRLRIGQTSRVSLKVDEMPNHYDMNFQVIGSDESYPAAISFTHEKTIARTIGAWFGGNRPAPKRMEIYISMSK